MSLRWTWDFNKATRNLEKHKVSFELAEQALDDPFCLSVRDPFPDEERWRYHLLAEHRLDCGSLRNPHLAGE